MGKQNYSSGETVSMVKHIAIVLFLTLYIAVFRVWGGTGVVSNYDYGKNNCKCTGTEDNSRGGKGPRDFIVKCEQSSDTAEFRRRRVFTGNPHGCGKYNKEQQKFYDQLLKEIGQEMCKERYKKDRNGNDVRDYDGIKCDPLDTTEYVTDLCPNLGKNKDFKLAYCLD